MSKSTAQNASQSQPPPATTRGKRKLDFSRDAKPFRGKTFFFDIPGHKSIEQEIIARGGIVEKFLHRGVRYLVTNRHKNIKKGGASTPSPDTPGSGCGIPSVASISPNSVDGGKSKTAVPVAHGTRAAKMLAASYEKQRGKKVVDVTKMAKEWGIKLFTIEELKAELRKMKAITPERERLKKSKHRTSGDAVRELKPPFMKIVDDSGLYRPLVYETDSWPHVNPKCPPGACPFDSPKMGGKVTQLSRATGARLTQDLVASLPAPAPSGPATTRKKSGYCECCSLRYEDLKMHLQSKKHRAYATNDANFATLDAFVAEKDLTYESFIQSRKETCLPKQDDCSVLLITPPSSPSAHRDHTPSPCPTIPTMSHQCKISTPDKRIITSGFATSPKLGSLCLTPVKVSGSPRVWVPAVTTPLSPPSRNISKVKVDKDKDINRRQNQESLTKETDLNEHLSPSLHAKRKRRKLNSESPLKHASHMDREDYVPETPEKLPAIRVPSGSPLFNIQEVLHRAMLADKNGINAGSSCTSTFVSPVKRRMLAKKITNVQELLDEVTRDSPFNSSLTLSPGTSPLTRKSPRLLKKGEPSPSLTVESGTVQSFPPPGPLTISLPLTGISLHQEQDTPTLPLPPDHMTPEIDALGPIQPIVLERIFQSIVGGDHTTGTFHSLINNLQERVAVTSESDGFEGFSPKNVKGSIPEFAQSLFLMGAGGGEEGWCVQRHSPRPLGTQHLTK